MCSRAMRGFCIAVGSFKFRQTEVLIPRSLFRSASAQCVQEPCVGFVLRSEVLIVDKVRF